MYYVPPSGINVEALYVVSSIDIEVSLQVKRAFYRGYGF